MGRRSGGSGGGAKFAVQIAIQARDLASRVVRGVADGIRKSFARMVSRIRSFVDFGAKLGTVFQTWGSWALDLGRKIAGVVTETSDLLSKVSDLSVKTGIGTDTLQELAYAAGQTGVETESLYKGVEAMSRKFGDMAAGGKELATFLLTIGGPAFLKQAKAAKTNEERLDLMLVALGKIEGEEKRAAFATKVFGKTGEDMVLMLNDGADGLKRLREEAHRFGVVQGPEAVAAAEEFGDEMAKVGAAWTGAKATFGSEVMRQLLPQLKQMTEWIAQNPAKIREMATALATGVVSAVNGIRDGFKWIYEHRDDIIAVGSGLAIAFTAAMVALNPIIAALALLVALGSQAKPKTQDEKDQALLAGHKKSGTLGGAMSLTAGSLNEGGLMGLAASAFNIGQFVSDENQLLAEAADRRRQSNFVESGAANDMTRLAMLAQPTSSFEGTMTINLTGPGAGQAQVTSVDVPVGDVSIKKTGSRTLGTGTP